MFSRKNPELTKEHLEDNNVFLFVDYDKAKYKEETPKIEITKEQLRYLIRHKKHYNNSRQIKKFRV